MPDSPQLEYDTSFPTASADITDIRQSFHRSFLSTVKQHFMRTTVNQQDKPDPDVPQEPPAEEPAP